MPTPTAVLNKLITRLRPGGPATEAGAAGHDAQRFALLCRHFPIGARLTYFPEYRREFRFSTLILGYRIDAHTLYSQDGVELDDDEQPCAFRIDARTVIPLARLGKLRLLLPDTSAHQKKLDYVTRAELGRDGQFRKGATITLQARSVGRGVPTLDTLVDRKETLAAGPFAGQETVLVDPDLESIKVVDKRSKPRVSAGVDAALLSGEGTAAAATMCRMVDFSEDTLRLRASSEALPALKNGSVVAVQFALGSSCDSYRVRGRVLRQSEYGVVIRFAELYAPASDSYRRIETFDVLEIKTGLLNPRG